MIDRAFVRCVWVALLAVVFSSASYAAKKKPATSPAPSTGAPSTPKMPGTPARPDSTALTAVVPPGVALTPGPLVTTGSPVKDRTTIAPFPIPGDTSRAARARAKTMNVPRQGVTTLEPMSPLESFSTLPQQLTEPEPVYPKAARDAGVEGIVVVMPYVLPDGSVGETSVLHSIPALDDAAVQAVKRMRFRPALFHEKPYAAWVVIPVKFTLH